MASVKSAKRSRRIPVLAVCMALLYAAAGLTGCGAGADAGSSDAAAENRTEQSDPSDMTAESGTGQEDASETAAAADTAQADGVSVVATIFPVYDWAREIIGDADAASEASAELTLLTDDGVDMHSFQPSAEDIARIADCDVFLYVGGESDEWVGDVLEQAENPDLIAVNLMDVLGDSAVEEEEIEISYESEEAGSGDSVSAEDGSEEAGSGEAESRETESEETESEETGSGDSETDEHIWLSLRNAQTLCAAIEGALQEADPAHAAVYTENCSAYIDALAELDAEYTETITASNGRTLLFADRFPFRYLIEDYDLEYYAAFSGCEADTQASFEVIAYLIDRTEETKADVLLVIDGGDTAIAETVIRDAGEDGMQILTLDSMQSVTLKEAQSGTTYLSVMESNLTVLEQALE